MCKDRTCVVLFMKNPAGLLSLMVNVNGNYTMGISRIEPENCSHYLNELVSGCASFVLLKSRHFKVQLNFSNLVVLFIEKSGWTFFKCRCTFKCSSLIFYYFFFQKSCWTFKKSVVGNIMYKIRTTKCMAVFLNNIQIIWIEIKVFIEKCLCSSLLPANKKIIIYLFIND